MRILVVEDEIGIANFLKQGLEEEGYTVDVSQEGNEGLKLALSGHYALLILDWMLPEISGLEICEAFRKSNTQTPVIFLTAKDTVQETIMGLQIGANDYIKKPFHFEELLERIRVQLRTNAVTENVLRLGPITLHLDSHEVTKNDERIALTHKEFDLLALLIQNKGKVCTRTEIIESVWDIHFDYNTSVIDVFINALRKKLSLTESENYIQTVRGVGYIAKEI
jgi:two-component system copper resistance phosphate regulon response regulator CusR